MATGTTITTYSDREFLFRLQTLVIDGGTGVLRNIFDQRLQNQPLNTVLASEQSTVNRLVRHGTLTRAQYNLLYPSSGQPPTTSNFDITLIVCLLRNLPSLGCNQNYNWNVPPQTGDTSVEADVWRLRAFRNEIAHISSTTGFQQSSFQSKWCEIESVLLRLDQNSPTPNFSQTIDSYKYSAMDPANEKRIRTMIEQWQERDLGLETDMQLIKKDVGVLKKDFSDTKEDVKSIKKGSSDTKEDIKSIKDNFSDTKEDVKSIKKDFGDTKEYVKSIKEDFSNTKEDVKSIKKDFSDTKEDVKSITKGLSDTQDDVNSMKKDVSDTKDEVKSIKKDVSELKQDLQDDLISFYKHKHRSIPLSPLMEEEQPLLKFYVMPGIQSVKVTRSRGDKPEKTLVTTLRDVFYKENKLCSNIYLTADAGYGKTAFSKKLALAWCHAKKPDKNEKKHFSNDEITAMGGFRFVFVVFLRDSFSECDIDELILNQILSQLPHDYSLQNLRKILCEETCLVILDGLDELTHPLNSCRQVKSNTPHQRVRENIAVLTTTRPWKLSVIGLHSSQNRQKT